VAKKKQANARQEGADDGDIGGEEEEPVPAGSEDRVGRGGGELQGVLQADEVTAFRSW